MASCSPHATCQRPTDPASIDCDCEETPLGRVLPNRTGLCADFAGLYLEKEAVCYGEERAGGSGEREGEDWGIGSAESG